MPVCSGEKKEGFGGGGRGRWTTKRTQWTDPQAKKTRNITLALSKITKLDGVHKAGGRVVQALY